MEWTTRLGLVIFISVPWGRVSPIPYASPISSDAHKDQLLLLFRYHSVTPLNSPGRKVSPRARNDAKKTVILSRTASSIYHHPRPVRESRQPMLKINGLVNKQINPLCPGKMGEEIVMARKFYSCCSLSSTLPGNHPRRKYPVAKEAPTQSTPWRVQKWIPIQRMV